MNSFIKKYLKLNPFVLSAIIILVWVFIYLIGVPFLDLMELKTIDLRFKSRGTVSPNSDVVLAVIDEKSIEAEGKWVWPRSKFIDLVEKLSEAGVKVIAFDVGFLEPDDKKTVLTLEKIESDLNRYGIRNDAFKKYLQTLKRISDDDTRFAQVIENSSAKVVLGHFFHMAQEESGHIDQKELAVHLNNVRTSMYDSVLYTLGKVIDVPLIDSTAPQSNIDIISNAAKYSGFFNMYPDQDGVVRWIPGIIKCKDKLYAPLSLMTLSAYLDEPISTQIAEYGVESVYFGKRTVPTDEIGRILINYRGKEKSFRHIPITDILHDEVRLDELKDKIVLVGATAVGIYDLRVTPYGEVFPGLEIHANIIDGILSNDYLFQPGWAAIFDIMAIIIIGLLLWIILSRGGVISGAVAAALIFSGYIGICLYLFSQKGWILNLVYPLFSIIFVYVGLTAYKYLVESEQKKFIKDAFSTYLSPTVVKQLVDSPESLELGGEERKITAFFSDVQGFTSISEKLTPHELVELLNEFLTEMTDIILKNEGTVDKFEGDAIIAFYGAPNELEHQEEAACKACVEMQNRLVELREKWHNQRKPRLRMRIGLCTGLAVVGNMGSKNRMDYTMMGDTVNTAARLEGVNKIYKTFNLISDSTHSGLSNRIITREIDSVNVVGKEEPVTIYQLLGFPERVDEKLMATLEHYRKGLAAYRSMDWDRAIEFFINALNTTINDGPSKTMMARCNWFKQNPPKAGWNRAFTITSK